MRDVEGHRERLAAAVVSALVPALAVMGLVRLPVPGLVGAGRRAADASIEVVFLRRPRAPTGTARPAPQGMRERTGASSALFARGRSSLRAHEGRRVDGGSHPLPADGVASPAGIFGLDLTVRDPAEVKAAGRQTRGGFERERPMDPRTTRFERAWVPAGNALEQARFRSAAMDAALGLFGSPPRRCSEVERRLRVLDCLSLDPDEADDEALRRSID